MADHHGGSDLLNNAEVVPCIELDTARGGAQIVRELPWAFVRLGGETTRYVMTGDRAQLASPAHGVAVRPQAPEAMRFKPFPHDLDRPPVSAASGDLAKAGPLAVHFFGNV